MTAALLFQCAAASGCRDRAPEPAETDLETKGLLARVEESRGFEREAGEALERGDPPAYLENIRAAARLRPHHPILLYHLARASAQSGDEAGAMAALHRLAAMGVARDVGPDSAFAPLGGSPGFAALLARFDSNAAPLARSRLAFEVRDSSFLPEGLTRDPTSGAFFVSSVHLRRVVRVEGPPSGRGAAPAVFAGDSPWSPMGMVVDTARGLLWAATSAVAEGRGTDSVDLGHAAVVAFDLGTGERRGAYSSPADGREHWFGDLALVPGGDLLVSDSRAPELYRLHTDSGSLEPVPMSEPLSSPQGVAVSADGSAAYLADYALGVLRIDLASGATTALAYPDSATLLGIDGLYRRGRSLIAVQNGVRPTRVLRLALDPGGASITRVEVLEAGHPLHDDPTLGVISGDTFYYVANSQWARFANGADPRVAPPRILALPLAGPDP